MAAGYSLDWLIIAFLVAALLLCCFVYRFALCHPLLSGFVLCCGSFLTAALLFFSAGSSDSDRLPAFSPAYGPVHKLPVL
jgi:hypothetical protein